VITPKSVATYKIGVDTIKIDEGMYNNIKKSISACPLVFT
jgi:hypothetical protein